MKENSWLARLLEDRADQERPEPVDPEERRRALQRRVMELV